MTTRQMILDKLAYMHGQDITESAERAELWAYMLANPIDITNRQFRRERGEIFQRAESLDAAIMERAKTAKWLRKIIRSQKKSDGQIMLEYIKGLSEITSA